MSHMLGVWNPDITEAGINGYYVALEDLSDEEMVSATKHALKTCRHMPRPEALRAFVRGRKEEQAETAWFQFLRVFQKHGASVSIECPDPVTAAALRHMGGLSTLARRNSEDFARFAKRDFIAAWMHCHDAIEKGELTIGADAQTLAGRLGRHAPKVCLPGRKQPTALQAGEQRSSHAIQPGKRGVRRALTG